MKTIKLTEEKIKELIAEAVKQLADSNVLKAEIDVPAYEVSKGVKKVVSFLDSVAEEYLNRYDETGQELYDQFGSRLYSISEKLEKFMDEAGYDKYMRKRDEEI